MRAHQFGNGLGLAAPEAAPSGCAAGAALVVADAASPAGVNPQRQSALVAQATQSREQIEQQNSVTGASVGKVFQTLRVELALRGYGLCRTHGDDGQVCFHVNRWGTVRVLSDIASALAFDKQAGATHA